MRHAWLALAITVFLWGASLLRPAAATVSPSATADEIARLRAENQQLRQENEDLRTEKETRNQFITSLQSTNEQLEQGNQVLLRTVRNSNDEVAKWRTVAGVAVGHVDELRGMIDAFLKDVEKADRIDERLLAELEYIKTPQQLPKGKELENLALRLRWRLRNSLRDRRGPREFLGQSLESFDEDLRKPIAIPRPLDEPRPRAKPGAPVG